MANCLPDERLRTLDRKARKDKSQRLKKIANPLQAGILTFLAAKRPQTVIAEKDLPKRYTRYGSLLMLGPTFFEHSISWTQVFDSLTEADTAGLFSTILAAFKDDSLTHVAMNAPIAPMIDESCQERNVMRSPSGLQPVYGNFGPNPKEYDVDYHTRDSFDAAYWTQTIQLSDIVQVWAPRWTMFSRGNVSEKARILQHGQSNSPFAGLTEAELGQRIDVIDVADFYIGIGYFALCYLKRGVARVWGWDINRWSIEGLRRGCAENGWGVLVLEVDDDGNLSNGQSARNVIADLRSREGTVDAVRCIAFCGDNRWVPKVLAEFGSLLGDDGGDLALKVRHCNLGLLPTSENSWQNAVRVIDRGNGGWLHIHENVAKSDILTKQQHILNNLQHLLMSDGREGWSAQCCHVEQVKTYAPGVVHCVYDVQLCPPS